MRHYIKTTDFTKDDFTDLFRRTDFLFEKKKKTFNYCRGKVIATLFFQPSTRTVSSFQSGILKMGGGWIGISGPQGTSMEKQEDFEDTIKTYSSLVDLIILRHLDEDAAQRATVHSSVPIVSAGCGSREHPGAYLQFYSAARRLNKFFDLKFGIYGVPGLSRVAKSLVRILGMFSASIFIDDLGGLFPLSQDVESEVKELGAREIQHLPLKDFIGEVDVLCVTEVLQSKNLIENLPKEKVKQVFSRFVPISPSHVKLMKQKSVLTMPTPRVSEIEKSVDADHRAIYFSQNEDFLYLNMALMTKLLDITLD